MPILDLTNRKSPEELNKLPPPSNEDLKKLFVDLKQFTIKEGGVYEDKAMYDRVLLTFTHPDDIQKFHQLLGINDNNGFYCSV